MYGLGSFVKSIGKGIKKIVKSPIGKAAILGFGANALMPGGLSSLFSGSSLPGMFGKAKNFIGGLSGIEKGLGAFALGSAFDGMEDQQIEELKGNPKALREYLEQYYDNLNLPKVDTNNPNEMEAYATKKEDFLNRNMQANGGRIGYDDGTNPKKDFLIKKGYGDMVKNMSVIEIDQLFNSVKGTTTAANTYREPAYMGGRIGYNDGTPKEEIVQPSASMMVDTTTSNPIPEDADRQAADEIARTMMAVRSLPPEDGEIEDTETMSTKDFMYNEYFKPKRKELMENYGLSLEEANNLIKEAVSKIRNNKAMGGRINRAYGSDELVEQASGIEGLDININPKGVKELDLRETGGFIPPVGVKEKADDIPAMLSNNEFVFTADAVRAAGGGSVNKGAQIMYDTMKKLENGGTV